MNALLDCLDECGKSSYFKESYQRLEANAMLEMHALKRRVKSGKYRPGTGVEFPLCERGRVRPVRAPTVRDRVAEKAMNQIILMPEVRRRIIYDNTASIQNRGVDMARRRFETHLRKHIAQYGMTGWVAFIDQSKYYDNIDHEQLKAQFAALTPYEAERQMINALIDSFAADVSWMSEAEYQEAVHGVYNSLTALGKHGDGSRLLHKGLNIGTEPAQSGGIYYPHEVDNYFKIARAVKGYGRYQDDTYIFARTKAEAEEYVEIAAEKYAALGITVNRKKTHVQPITQPMRWLKIRYIPKDSGAVLMLPDPANFRRERQRISGYAHLLAEGVFTKAETDGFYRSWRGSMKRYDCHAAIARMDEYYRKHIGRIDTYDKPQIRK